MWTDEDEESEEGEETDSNLPGLKMIPFMLQLTPHTQKLTHTLG